MYPPPRTSWTRLTANGVCLGASKRCVILRHTPLSWLWCSFVVLLAIRHHFKRYSTHCLMCCFFKCFYLFLTERSAKQTVQPLKGNCFLSKINSQINEQGWFSRDLLTNNGKKRMALKPLPASGVHWAKSLAIKLLRRWNWSKSDPKPLIQHDISELLSVRLPDSSSVVSYLFSWETTGYESVKTRPTSIFHLINQSWLARAWPRLQYFLPIWIASPATCVPCDRPVCLTGFGFTNPTIFSPTPMRQCEYYSPYCK